MTDSHTGPREAGSDIADLGAVFDEHVRREFVDLDVPAVMATMVAEPSLFHVPTMAGGRGWRGVRDFYRDHFVGRWPADVEVTRVARTIGREVVVDELVITFTHDREIPVLLPAIPLSGRRIELVHAVVVSFDAGQIASEHIYWDQASLLSQVGLLDRCRAPVTGVEQARALRALAPRLQAAGQRMGQCGADLGQLFDTHLQQRLVERSRAAVPDRLSAGPAVLCIPAARCREGRDEVERFWARVVGSLPADLGIERVARAVGENQVVDELIISFTHDSEMELLLPGVAPTGRAVQLPLVAAARFDGDAIADERFYWDHGSLLVQVGLLDAGGLPVLGGAPAGWLRDGTGELNPLLSASVRSLP